MDLIVDIIDLITDLNLVVGSANLFNLLLAILAALLIVVLLTYAAWIKKRRGCFCLDETDLIILAGAFVPSIIFRVSIYFWGNFEGAAGASRIAAVTFMIPFMLITARRYLIEKKLRKFSEVIKNGNK